MKTHLPAGVANLLQHREGLHISLVLPTDPVNPAGPENHLRYRNLIRAAEQRAQTDGLDAAAVEQVLKPAYDLLDNAPFWQHLGRGLAVYVAPNFQHTYRLPYPAAEQLLVGAEFLITPLVPLIADDEEFFVLALSRGAVRLLSGTCNGISEVDLPAAVPTSLAVSLGGKVYEPEQRYVAGPSSARGRPGAIFYGQGGGTEPVVQLQHYCEQIDHGLGDIAGMAGTPLILAGEEEILAMYRQVTTYPHVLEAEIVGNPDHLSAAALHERAWPLIEAQLRHEREEVLDRYRRLLGTGLASADHAEIAAAAQQGRIDTLLVCQDEAYWGAYDPATGRLISHATRLPGDEDVANLAVIGALRHSGAALVVPRDQLPGDLPFAAIFRY